MSQHVNVSFKYILAISFQTLQKIKTEFKLFFNKFAFFDIFFIDLFKMLFSLVIDCGQPEPFSNGYIEVQSTTIGSIIYFYCFDGMVFDGLYTNSTCGPNSTWIPEPFPKCLGKFNFSGLEFRIFFYCYHELFLLNCIIIFYCILAPCIIPIIENGYVDGHLPRTMIQHGQSINVTCIDNYDLLSFQSNSIVCQNGTWSQFPVCVPGSVNFEF